MKLKHFALYAKGHYQRSGDFWADIYRCLIADGYTPECNQDVVTIIVNVLTRDIFGGFNITQLMNKIVEETNPYNCWKFGFYTKDHNWTNYGKRITYDSATAVVYWYLSYIRFTDTSKIGDIGLPDDKVLPLTPGAIEFLNENKKEPDPIERRINNFTTKELSDMMAWN